MSSHRPTVRSTNWEGVTGTLLVSCGVLLVSCGYDGKSWHWEKRVGSSIGMHRSQLIKELGPPASETSLSESGSRLLYLEVRKHSGKYGGTIMTVVCRTTFDADEEGIVRSATFHGCRPE